MLNIILYLKGFLDCQALETQIFLKTGYLNRRSHYFTTITFPQNVLPAAVQRHQ